VKKISFSRKAIIRAIHAACVALFLLAAAQREALAQSYTAPFQVSGSTVTSSSGSYGNSAGLDEFATTYTSLSIGAGTTITATLPYGGNGIVADPYSLVTAGASSFSNSGSLTLNSTNGSGSGNYQATVFLNQGATSVTATNSGSISTQLWAQPILQRLWSLLRPPATSR
jgi:hypothetical protein